MNRFLEKLFFSMSPPPHANSSGVCAQLNCNVLVQMVLCDFVASYLSYRPVQNVKLVRIDYWVEKAETGVHFNGNVLHTNNQLRRARCWFPCLDDSLQCCGYLQG